MMPSHVASKSYYTIHIVNSALIVFMFVFRFFPSPGLMSPVSCVKVLYELFHPHNTMFSLSTITPHFFPPTLIQSVLVVG